MADGAAHRESPVIIRVEEHAFVLIRQPDHAVLAADLISGWTDGGFPSNPRRSLILEATRAHDNGWEEEDAELMVGADGTPVDFIAASSEVKHRVWPRGIDRLAAETPYGAALVAEHALTVYAAHRSNADWQGFFGTMAALRAVLLTRCDREAVGTIDEDYRFVRMADILSLIFCNDWREPIDHDSRRMTLIDRTLTVSPDPFSGREIRLRVAARRIPRRPYASAADLRSEVAAAPTEFLEGAAVGG
jgi:hypothetical protein